MCFFTFFRSMYPSRVWDFLQDTIPKFKQRDESLTVTKPDMADPAAGTDSSPNDNKGLLPEPNNSKGLDCATHTHYSYTC